MFSQLDTMAKPAARNLSASARVRFLPVVSQLRYRQTNEYPAATMALGRRAAP